MRGEPNPDEQDWSWGTTLRKAGELYLAWLIGCVVFGLPTSMVIWLIWRGL